MADRPPWNFPCAIKISIALFGEGIAGSLYHSSFAAAFLASLAWMAALTKFRLSYAYPFMSLSFLLVLLFSYLLFKEPLTISKLAGVILIIIGLYFTSR